MVELLDTFIQNATHFFASIERDSQPTAPSYYLSPSSVCLCVPQRRSVSPRCGQYIRHYQYIYQIPYSKSTLFKIKFPFFSWGGSIQLVEGVAGTIFCIYTQHMWKWLHRRSCRTVKGFYIFFFPLLLQTFCPTWRSGGFQRLECFSNCIFCLERKKKGGPQQQKKKRYSWHAMRGVYDFFYLLYTTAEERKMFHL